MKLHQWNKVVIVLDVFPLFVYYMIPRCPHFFIFFLFPPPPKVKEVVFTPLCRWLYIACGIPSIPSAVLMIEGWLVHVCRCHRVYVWESALLCYLFGELAIPRAFKTTAMLRCHLNLIRKPSLQRYLLQLLYRKCYAHDKVFKQDSSICCQIDFQIHETSLK